MLNPEVLNPQQKAVHDRMRTDLEFYARNALKIKLKKGGFEPYVFNQAQKYLHEQTEKMLRECGLVRIVIVKGRQQGCSTYVAARFFHKATWQDGKSVFILSHESTSTDNLFQKVEDYYHKLPALVKPVIDVSNRRQLKFVNGSEYRLGTAGASSTGRGQTNQYLHGSEVAFYLNTDEISSGVLQTVADVPGTEIFLESTANGMAGMGAYFYQAAINALEGKGLYRLVFIPWYWQEEYRYPAPDDFELTDDEYKLKEAYDLDNDQLYWRRLKTYELKSEWLFKQEYPFTAMEAFQTSGESLLDPLVIQEAKKATVEPQKHLPLIMGVDAAKKGDRTVLAFRRGNIVEKVEVYNEMDEMRLAGIIGTYIDKLGVSMCFIDYGSAYGTITRLEELGYSSAITGVSFGGAAIDDVLYLNKRAEMGGLLRDWFNQEQRVKIPDDTAVEADLLAVPDFKLTSSQKNQLPSKAEIKKTYGRSPDIFDAICLTFAFPVRSEIAYSRLQKNTVMSKSGSPLKTMSKIRTTKKAEDAVQYGLWDRID